MKKASFILAISFFFLFVITTISSCENDSVNECETCQLNDHESISVKLNNKSYEAKKYYNKQAGNYIQLKIEDKKSTFNFLNKIKEQVKNIDLDNIAGFVVGNSKINNYDLNNLNFETIIIYENNLENFNVRSFNLKNGIITEVKELTNLKTNYYNTNDVYNIFNLIKNTEKVNVFSFIFPNFTLHSKINSQLSSTLKNQLSISNKVVDPKKNNCGGPCNSTEKNKVCRGVPIDGDGYNIRYFCDKECGTEEVEGKLVSGSINNYDFISIKSDLRIFKENYLSDNGGDEIINQYYELSDNLIIDNFDLNMCIRTYDMISNDIIPLVRELNNNPQSNNILYNNQIKQNMIDYLNDVKLLYEDEESISKINNMINKVNYFSNKSNYYITNHLNEF